MTNDEIEGLRLDVVELRRAVRKANPFLRAIMEIRDYALMSIPLGVLILVYCLASHFLVLSYGSYAAIPAAWRTAAWIAFGLFIVLTSVWKWRVVGKRAAEVEKGATFWTVFKAMYGTTWINMNLPLLFSVLTISGFAILVGAAWYLVPAGGVFFGLTCIAIAQAVERREYLITGWYALATGLASLFFIESAPFLWTAAVWAGIFLVYAASGLYYLPREEKEG